MKVHCLEFEHIPTILNSQSTKVRRQLNDKNFNKQIEGIILTFIRTINLP